MKIKLKGIDELKAFTVIVRLLLQEVSAPGANHRIESLIDLCHLLSVERLMAKLIRISVDYAVMKKKVINITLDDLQMCLLYYHLLEDEIRLGAYEQNLAIRLVAEIDMYYHNELAWRNLRFKI